MTYSEFCDMMKDMMELPMKRSFDGYSYGYENVSRVFKNHGMFDLVGFVRNCHLVRHGNSSDDFDVDEDLVLHCIESAVGYSTYPYSRSMHDRFILDATSLVDVMNEKMMLNYTEKKDKANFIKEIAEGLCMKKERLWHDYDEYSGYTWNIKVPLITGDNDNAGTNLWFEKEV